MTPLCKAFNTEMCNRVAYNGIQVHGGVGFTKEFDAERHYRDARITNIYEGTTQLQVVAAIGGVAGGTLVEYLASLDEEQDWSKVSNLIAGARAIRAEVEAALGLLKTRPDSSACVEHHARRLVDMAADAVIAHLMTRDANHDHPMAAAKKANAQWFIAKALAKAKGTVAYIQANPTRPE
jgi:alkylation response protein AidB-like acyl-CoA dehydrogenase